MQRPLMPLAATSSDRTVQPSRQRIFVLVTLSVACIFGGVSTTGASATKIEDKRAKAAKIAAQIDSSHERQSQLDEDLNGARLRISELDGEIVDAQRKAASSQRNTESTQSIMAERAAAMYRNAGADNAVGMRSGDIGEQGSAAVYAQALVARDRELIDDYRNALDEATADQARLNAARNEAQRQAKIAENATKELERSTAQLSVLLAQTQGELSDLIQAEQARRAAQAEAAGRKRQDEQRRRDEAARRQRDNQQSPPPTSGGKATTPTSADGSGGGQPGGGGPRIIARNPRAQVAVDTAMAQIGKPYQFAAAGPDRFDCSGLMIFSWARAGVGGLPHQSRALYALLPKISMDELQPGDFVYYGSPIHHMGMFIGGGKYVNAPQTGDFVKIASIYRNDYAGATRVP